VLSRFSPVVTDLTKPMPGHTSIVVKARLVGTGYAVQGDGHDHGSSGR